MIASVVAWNMAEKTAFAALLRSPGDAVVLLATFLLTIFEDSTAAKALEVFVHKLRHSGTCIYFTGTEKGVRRMLIAAGLRKPLVRYAATVEGAMQSWRCGTVQ